MAQPVLVDDGGSTRVKQLRSSSPTGPNGKLDNLIEVDTSSAPANSKDFAPGPFSQIRVTCIDDTGAATFLSGATAIAMAVNHTFKVHSGKHRLEGRIVDRTSEMPPGSAKDCEITISGVSGTEPIVEARHNNGQRRYIISNAPPIGKVEINAAGPAQSFTVPAGTIYTVVVLS